MSNLRKTIQINPNLFKIGGKSRKNKGEKLKPIISPNLLKNKLLKRIKEHKQTAEEKQQTEYTDEFNDSLEYLKSLTVQKKTDELKEKLKKKTIRNNLHLQTSPSLSKNYEPQPIQQVDLDLPEELKEPMISPIISPIISNSIEPYKLDKEVPYGCLKNGFKKTFKNYKTSNNTSEPLSIRELKLQQLREKRNQSISTSSSSSSSFPLQIKENVSMPIQLLDEQVNVSRPFSQNKYEPSHQQQQQSQYINESREPIKQTIKKTTIRKYKLGKSKTHRVVGILIKDNHTRKKVLNAHKELKKTQMNVIKKYLNEKNMIMCGSNAPNDVLRKMYEMLMLSGEIHNNNKDIMLHNFLKTTDEI